jgi:hypothetical protein
MKPDEGDLKNWKDPSFYRLPNDCDDEKRPANRCDYRNQGGPLLSYVWSSAMTAPSSLISDQPSEELHMKSGELQGQNLYLGAEISSADGCIYCIPGHADRVLRIDPATDVAIQVGPQFVGKYKWLRGVEWNGVIFGLPCHADTVLKIDVPNNTISHIEIPYETFFSDDHMDAASQERHREWKYHGGDVSPVDGCIYAIPQSAHYVLKIDPNTDRCSLVGPALGGKYQWYGGIVGKQDGAIYGVPHNSPHVLRIHPVDGVTLHGELTGGLHKWHGGAAAANGVIVCVAANADAILCITPSSPEPFITMVGDATVVQSGRHRSDRKYKYLGATMGPDGRVYMFPCAAEHVLAVDTVHMTAHQIGPNIYDANLERLCQNKWQNGVFLPEQNCIFGIPLAAESLLQIDFNRLDDRGDPMISTWPIPAPHRNMAKWEGAVVAPNGVAYSIPNNHKALLRIELPTRDIRDNGSISPEAIEEAGTFASSILPRDRPDYSHRDDLVYKSGIPTLRASAHRVKFSPKNRKHDPRPKNSDGVETGSLWLPKDICNENVLSFDIGKYNVQAAIVTILQSCDPNIVGRFRDESDLLEDFIVPTQSTWRTVNGGQCESAQRYLSDAVSSSTEFLRVFDELVAEVVLPNLKDRLIAVGAAKYQVPITFYYQRPPTLRLQPGPAWAQVKAHNDAEYGHQYGEINFWVPLTDRVKTGVDLWCESNFETNDYHPISAKVGEMIAFHGSSCRHYVNANASEFTRVSFDFRVGVQGFFDPDWEMKGTNDDHTRHSITL